jgi:hypothetical protein
MKRLILLAAALPAFAAVQGIVSNQTTGKPQPNAIVTLMNLGGGMSNLGSVRTDAEGAFRFDKEIDASAPYLVQVLHQGVTYNRMLQPGTAALPMTLEVYDASAKVPEAKVTQHMILFEPSGSQLTISESVIFTNSGKTTYQDPAGTLRFRVPNGVSPPVQVRISAPQGMPITRQAEPGSQPNTYAVKYPIKPGETRIDLNYAIAASAPVKVSNEVLHGGGPVRLVVPQGVTLEGPGLTSLGSEPQSKASIYELKGAKYALTIGGTGALPTAAAAAPAAPAEEDSSGGIDIVKPRIFGRAVWVVSLALLMLLVGFVMLYRAGTPVEAVENSKAAGKSGKRA